MSKPAAIQILERQTGFALKPLESETFESALLRRRRNTYALDAQGRVAALNLCDNDKLTRLELPAELAPSLRLLNVSGCSKLRTLILPPGTCPALEKLDASESALEQLDVPAGCDALQWLDLRKNKLARIVFAGPCPALEYLDLSENQLEGDLDLPAGFGKLLYLYLNENQLDRLRFPGGLPMLETLQARANRLTALPAALPRLETINVENNRLTDLEPLLPQLRRGMALLAKENPWERPPAETVEKGREAILNYFEEIQQKGVKKSLEAKLILIGEAKAGKTSLRTRLIRPEAELPSTDDRTKGLDVEIENYLFTTAEGDQMCVNVFDFGGQDHYKPLHQFFYSRRSLYVLVTANGATTDVDFWLDTAQLFGEGSPVLVLINLFGEVGGEFNRKAFNRFDAILRDPVSTNLLTKKDWPQTKKRIEHLVETLPHVQQFIPVTWDLVRRELLARRAENALPLSEFLKICARPENGAMDTERALRCSEYLHDVGICLHYQDDEELRRQVIVKNEWATEAVYRVIDDETIRKKAGQFDWTDLRRIWAAAEYEFLRPELLALMKKFRLCYDLPDKKSYITPVLLPVTPPAGYAWPAGDDLQIFVEYDFLPPGLFTQLIVELHPYIAEGKRCVWREGVALEWPRARAEATLTKRSGRQSIGIRAQGAERRELLTYIDKQLDALHARTGKGLQAEKKIPCNCEKCLAEPTPYYFELSKLEKRLNNGVRDIECESSYKRVQIEPLLGQVFVTKMEAAEISPKTVSRADGPLRLFISYTHADEAYKTAFQKALGALVRAGKIVVWEDRQLLAGTRFDDEIEYRLRDADLVCLLISPDFMKSEYCYSKEMEAALLRYDEGQNRVLPVVIRTTVGWTELPIGKLTAANTDAKPIGQPNNDEGWGDVVANIQKLAQAITESRRHG